LLSSQVNPPSEKKNKKKKTGKARKASFRRRNRPHEVAPASPAESASGDADPVRDGEDTNLKKHCQVLPLT